MATRKTAKAKVTPKKVVRKARAIAAQPAPAPVPQVSEKERLLALQSAISRT